MKINVPGSHWDTTRDNSVQSHINETLSTLLFHYHTAILYLYHDFLQYISKLFAITNNIE